MKRLAKLLLFLSVIPLLSAYPTLAAPVKSEHILYGLPGTNGTILYRKGYALAHNNGKKVASWVSYHLTDAYLVHNVPRSNDFRPDPDLPKGQRSELKDYRKSGYDLGHLAPAEDMRRDEQTESETFLLSNMAPQVGLGFNRRIWKNLEAKVRTWAKKRHNIYIMTGPIYSDKNYPTIGPDKVAVPSHFYKIIVSCTHKGDNLDVIAFIMPNKDLGATPIKSYITTIDEVEKETGLNFLRGLPDPIEKKLEAKKAGMWE
ncbi:MAG: DNA/RNA non-specific endonuclease [Candidatus Margulisiibacteriota bacterium]